MEGLIGLGTAIIVTMVVGSAMYVMVMRLIDGTLDALPGFVGLLICVLLMLEAIKPTHPAIPAIILVTVISCMVMFPFAENHLAEADLREWDKDKLIKSYDAFAKRPDNFYAVFEIAKLLYAQGMKGHAIAVSNQTLEGLSQARDPVTNQSLRDRFRNEEQLLKRWNQETAGHPEYFKPIACPACKHLNPLDAILCKQCNRPYLLDVAASMTKRSKVYGRLVAGFALVAATIVGFSTLGLLFQGVLLMLMIFLGLLGAAGIFYWLFRTPKPA